MNVYKCKIVGPEGQEWDSINVVAANLKGGIAKAENKAAKLLQEIRANEKGEPRKNRLPKSFALYVEEIGKVCTLD